jgi:hypothetical protein
MEHIKIYPTLKYVTFAKVSACSSIAISFTIFSTNYTQQIPSWVIKSHSAIICSLPLEWRYICTWSFRLKWWQLWRLWTLFISRFKTACHSTLTWIRWTQSILFKLLLEDKTKYILSALPAFPVVSSFQAIFSYFFLPNFHYHFLGDTNLQYKLPRFYRPWQIIQVSWWPGSWDLLSPTFRLQQIWFFVTTGIEQTCYYPL